MNSSLPILTTADTVNTARHVGLRYVNDRAPGITRKRTRIGFRYVDAQGNPVKDKSITNRIKALVIPPAWQEVWISPWENGHIQATGRDAKGRKQYRYHARWRQVRDEVKYERMLNFGRMLPILREQVDAALKLSGLPREKVLATIIRLLELTLIRIGNEEYARTNRSFGLTTLRNKHVRIDGTEVEFQFRGKSGIQHRLKLQDRRVANIIKRMRELPGQELFQYIDDTGERHSVDSGDVNDYLKALTGEEYTAKDFRTWAATMLALLALLEREQYETQTQAKKNIDEVIKAVAQKLGNTPRICKNCYVHPLILEAYLQEEKWKTWQQCMAKKQEETDALACAEAVVLDFLSQANEDKASLIRAT